MGDKHAETRLDSVLTFVIETETAEWSDATARENRASTKHRRLCAVTQKPDIKLHASSLSELQTVRYDFRSVYFCDIVELNLQSVRFYHCPRLWEQLRLCTAE